MICVLFENDYFDAFELPDEAFEIGPAPHLLILGEVYGKYFAFYTYLEKKRDELKAKSGITQPQLLKTGRSRDLEKVNAVSTLSDTFRIIHKDKFDRIIAVLLKKLPPDIIDKFPELERLDGPILNEVENGYMLNAVLPSPISYLAGLYIVCRKKLWIAHYPYKKYKEVMALTFNLAISSTNQFKNAKYGFLDSKYIELFEILFENIR
jgi:hypothetical protein